MGGVSLLWHYLRHYLDLNLAFLPSSVNIADAPSRALSDAGCTLSSTTWCAVQSRYGPHDFDLCALDSNAVRDNEGRPLPHFTPWPTPQSSGVNIFAQEIPEELNLYYYYYYYYLKIFIHGSLSLL